MIVSFMCDAKHGCSMATFYPPYRMGVVDFKPPPTPEKGDIVEVDFEWHDSNPDGEDRNGYAVYLKEGRLKIGNKGTVIGVTTRVDDYDPLEQWVAISGRADVKCDNFSCTSGLFNDRGAFVSKKIRTYAHGIRTPRVVVTKVINFPKVIPKMFRKDIVEEQGLVEVL